MESIKWMFGYLLFHRKIILGILLVGGLVYWLVYGIDLVPKMSLKGDRPAGKTEQARPRKLPELEVFSRPVPKTETETLTGLGVEPESEPESSPGGEVESVIRNKTDSNRVESRFDRWLAEASIEELIEESLRLNDEWKGNGNDYPYIFLLLTKRKRISERLLEMHLTDYQNRFATVSFLESVSVLDSTNVQGKLGSETVRVELLDNANKYLDHPEQEIASLAHLSLCVIPGYEFIGTPSVKLLDQFEKLFDEHFADVAKSDDCIQKLAELIVIVYRTSELQNETRVFAEKAIQRFKSDTSDSGKLRFQKLQEQLHFGRLDLPTLVDRVSSKQPLVDADVREFAAALEQYPNASLPVHQVALDIIRELIRQDRKVMAREMIQQLETNVMPNIADQAQRQKVAEAADEFKPFL